MGRVRIGVVVFVCAIAVFGVPLESGAGSVPPTVRRDVTLESGTVAASSAHGVSMQRRVSSLPIKANLIALSFRATGATGEQLEEDLIIEARARGASGWSEWSRLGVEPDEAPDRAESINASTRSFTSPLWVGTAEAAEVRVVVPAGHTALGDLKLHLVNTLGNASNPNVVEKAVGAVSRWFRGSAAHAMTTQPSIVTRAQWGADESIRECCPRYATAVHMAFIHHTAGTNSYAASESPAIVRSIYAYHVKTRGWSDIGYNFLVDRHGKIFEGRYGGMTLPVIGAHVKGFNTGSTGISLMGTFTSASPTSAMVASLKNLLAWKMDVHHIPPTGTVVMTSGGSDLYPVGTKKTFNRISGHKDGQQTSCPGSKAYNLLPSIRTDVSKMGLPKLYLPTMSTDALTPNGDGDADTVTLTAGFTTTVTWTLTLRAQDDSVIKTFNGAGTSLAVTWNGTDPDGTLAKAGQIKWTMTGKDLLGHDVLPAVGSFLLVVPPRVVGDWDGDGIETPGTVLGNVWHLHNDFDGKPDVVFAYGQPTDRPIAGDWDGDGDATPGVVRGNAWFINNGTDPWADVAFAYGWASDKPVAGDWDGDGDDTPGLVRGNTWFLNDNFDQWADGSVFGYGSATDVPVAGDWDGDGKDTAGIVRGNVWFLNNDRDGDHDVPTFAFGEPFDTFVVGDWHKKDVDVAGVFHEPMWQLLNENAAGEPDIEFEEKID